MRGVTILSSTGVLLCAALFAGSQAAATDRSAAEHLMAVGRAGQPVTVTYEVPGGVGGSISQMIVIGRPGTTAEAGPDQDRLPPTAVERIGNELDAATSFTYTSLSARVTPAAPGTYPVFTFASRESGCGSSNMAEPPDLTITQIGQIQVG